jgi:iron complex outermembrane receptor protein
VSLSGYYYDYSKDQINGLTLFPTSAGVVGVLFTQLAPVKMYGTEAELHYQLDHATTLNASLAYEHSKIVALKAGALGYLTGAFGDFAGQPLPNTPKFVSNFSATHNFDLGGGSQLRLRGATKVSSGYNLTDFANAVQFRQKAYTRSDASLTYAAPEDRWTVQLFVENIQNKVQRTSGPNGYNGAYGGFTNLVPSPEVPNSPYPVNALGYGVSTPRFFGVRVGVKF